MPPSGDRERAPWRAHWPAVVLGLVGAAVAVLAQRHIFPALSWNRDEPVYLWQADALRVGFLTPPDGGHPALFQPWLAGHGDGAFFTKYTFGWPVALASSALVTGTTTMALALGAALMVVGTYALGCELLEDRRIAVVAAGLMVGSPILAIQGGVHLSYIFTAGLGLLFASLTLAGHRRRSGGRLLVAGLVLGWIFATRPYDAVLWAVAVFAYLGLVRREGRAFLGAALRVAAGALPLGLLVLAYNQHVTGGWLDFPITATDPLDRFGFGDRRLMPGHEVMRYDLSAALRASAKNAFVLPWFLAGSYLGVLAAAGALWGRRRQPAMLGLVLIGAAFPVGYFFFWGTHISSLASRISGPIYLVPVYPPLCLLAATLIVDWWSDHRARSLALSVALVLITVPAAISRFDVNHRISSGQEAWRSSVEDLSEPSIVFVADTAPYLLFANPFSSNSPTLDGLVLYASDRSPEMLDLIAEHPTRQPYVQEATVGTPELGPRERPADFTVRLRPAEVRRNATIALRWTVPASAKGRLSSLALSTAGSSMAVSPQDLEAGSGEIVISARPGSADLALGARGTLTFTSKVRPEVDRAGRPFEARVSYVYRVVDGVIELLEPAVLEREVLLEGRLEWRRALMLAHLRVEVATG